MGTRIKETRGTDGDGPLARHPGPLDAAYPNVRTVHPGHGASGPKQPMFDDERLYLRTCRAIATEEIARSGFTDAAKAATVRRINARFPYTNPTGQRDIVKNSVDGLFQEFAKPSAAPVG